MDWTQIELFIGIDLNDSFILDWLYEDNRLTFSIEASIWPGSKYYTKPENGEYTCYREGVLEFVNPNIVRGLKPIESVASSVDPDGSRDYGNIDSFKSLDGGFELSGEFGDVIISGGELRFEVRV